jgi:hypothetical protein
MPASAWRFGAPVGQPAWVDVPPDVIDNEAVPTRRTNMDQKEEPRLARYEACARGDRSGTGTRPQNA